MTFTMTPEKFFEAALVAIGPLPDHNTSDYEARAADFVAFRLAVLGIGRLHLGNTPQAAKAWDYSIGEYRFWWEGCRQRASVADRENGVNATFDRAFEQVFGEGPGSDL